MLLHAQRCTIETETETVLDELRSMAKQLFQKRFKNESFQKYNRQYPAEVFFCALYLLFLFTYNAARWWWYIYPRYIIPVLPFLYFALLPWVYKDRRFIWVIGALFSVLGGASSINVYLLWELFRSKNVWEIKEQVTSPKKNLSA